MLFKSYEHFHYYKPHTLYVYRRRDWQNRCSFKPFIVGEPKSRIVQKLSWILHDNNLLIINHYSSTEVDSVTISTLGCIDNK